MFYTFHTLHALLFIFYTLHTLRSILYIVYGQMQLISRSGSKFTFSFSLFFGGYIVGKVRKSFVSGDDVGLKMYIFQHYLSIFLNIRFL